MKIFLTFIVLFTVYEIICKLIYVATGDYPRTQTVGWDIVDIIFGMGLVVWGCIVLL